jgi:hypothetical protein
MIGSPVRMDSIIAHIAAAIQATESAARTRISTLCAY